MATTDVRIKVPKELLDDMKKKMHKTKSSDVMQEAVSLLKWAIDQTSKGNTIMSGVIVEGNEAITTPGLSAISTNTDN